MYLRAKTMYIILQIHSWPHVRIHVDFFLLLLSKFCTLFTQLIQSIESRYNNIANDIIDKHLNDYDKNDQQRQIWHQYYIMPIMPIGNIKNSYVYLQTWNVFKTGSFAYIRIPFSNAYLRSVNVFTRWVHFYNSDANLSLSLSLFLSTTIAGMLSRDDLAV